MIDTDPYPSTPHGGTWWEVAVPEVSERREVNEKRAAYEAATEGEKRGMSVRIGISPIAWQNDDLPDLTAAFTMEQALKEAREIGYTGVERGRRMPQDTEGLRAYLDRYDIALCGGWCSGNLMKNSVKEEIAAVRGQVVQFVALGAPCLVYAECSNTVQGDIGTPVNDRPKLSRSEVKAYAREAVGPCEVDAGRGDGARLPSPHGLDDRGSGGHRRADGGVHPRGHASLRHRAT